MIERQTTNDFHYLSIILSRELQKVVKTAIINFALMRPTLKEDIEILIIKELEVKSCLSLSLSDD